MSKDASTPKGLSIDIHPRPRERRSMADVVVNSMVNAGECDEDDEDRHALPQVADKVPLQVWYVILINTAERFAFFGFREPFQNYLQNPSDDPLRPGAFGLGQSTATNLSYTFSFLLYTMPLFAGWTIDCYFGRVKGLLVYMAIYLVGLFLLLTTSLPPSLEAGAGLPGWIVAIVLISIGLGGVKSSMSPLLEADQYTNFQDKVVTRPNGKRVLVVRDLSIDRIYHLYYWSSNLGALSALATTYLEKDVGFWAAYLLPFCSLSISGLTLFLCRNTLGRSPRDSPVFAQHRLTVIKVSRPPCGNILPKSFRVMACAVKHGFDLEAARPQHHVAAVPWDDGFVTDLQRGLIACRIFCLYPILWVCHLQINNNLVSQAAQMMTGGLPNDWFPTINPIAVLALLPVVSNGLYPLLRRLKIPFPPVNKMATGFVIEAIAIAYCAGIQRWIYSEPPCYKYPLECAASAGGSIPNIVNVWAQTPTYVLDGLSELFFDVVSQEYAYNKAPDNMKSIVQAVLSAMSGLGAALGFALYPVDHNPHLVWFYSGLAAAAFVTAVILWCAFHKYNEVDAELNKRDVDSDADTTGIVVQPERRRVAEDEKSPVSEA
ncbi:hypothetical protein LTR85_006382 [Meristemomyces frigidus]|nr:hypothetical protein LTR85_006382 [Meristemomyces frigidus]